MFEPEYRASFGVLRREIGLLSTVQITIPSMIKSRKIQYVDNDTDTEPEKKKNSIKNHFKLLSVLYEKLKEHYGEERTKRIIHEILIKCGPIFMRGFKSLKPNSSLIDFIPIYKEFESQNLVFEVIEESLQRFEIIVRRCLIYEAFKELGLESVTQWMCDIAFLYFSDYHSKLNYSKDRMIARGDNICRELFTWQD